MMDIVIGSDHGGFQLKEAIKGFIAAINDEKKAVGQMQYNVIDAGTFSEDSVDYPDIAAKACAEITAGRAALGILVCGTGIGISIAANKIHGIRAALCGDAFSAKMARRHNDANILCLGGRILGLGLAEEIVRAYLGASFEGGRHARRVEKMMALEN